jgi:adenylate cyclase, class 2
VKIGVKYRVGDLSGLAAALTTRGTELSAPVYQDDQAYAQDGWHRGIAKRGVAFARLRTQGGRYLFALRQPTGDELAYLEFETEVADRSRMHEAILQMGFYPTVYIGKIRRTARLGDMALRLDEVEHLGPFLEIERVVPAGWSNAAVLDALDAFACSLGVPLERTTERYDSLVQAALAAV